MEVETVDTRSLLHIQVPSRYRKDFGELEGLMRSMATIGLLHPLVITPDNQLIAGARRLEAAKRLGWTDIPVRVVNLASLLHGEHDENELRKDFTVTERVAIAQALEAEIAAENATRQKTGKSVNGEAGGRSKKKADVSSVPLNLLATLPEGLASVQEAKVAEVPIPLPKPVSTWTRERAGKQAGMAGRTYAKAKAVVKAAEDNPERFGDLPAKMDVENNVDAAHRALQQRQTTDILGKNPRQMADEDAARRWTKSLHDLYILMQSVEHNAGGDITVLTATWSATLRRQYAEELARITTVLTHWQTALTSEVDNAARVGTLPDDYARA